MTTAALIVAALALALAAFSVWVGVQARAEAVTARRELATHRKAHADNAEERRAGRRTPPDAVPTGMWAKPAERPQEHDERAWLGRDPLPDPEPATEQMAAQDAPTQMRPAVALPRPGRIGDSR